MSNYLYKTTPRAHQDDAFYFLYSLFMQGINYGALFMEQGTGKTKVTIDVASNLYREGKIDAVMVIAPNGVQDQWGDEQIPLHSPVPVSMFTWENNSSNRYIRELFKFEKSKPEALKWFLMNVEAYSYSTHLMIFKEFITMNRTLVVVDEATRIKEPSANRTINIIQGLADLIRLGKRVTGIIPKSAYRMVLTGTPITTGPYNVWSIFEFLCHDYFERDYQSFKGHYGLEVRAISKGSKKAYYRKVSVEEMNSIRKYKEYGKSYEDIARIMQISETSARFIVENPSVKTPYKNLEELKQAIAKVAFTVAKKDCLDLKDKIFEKRYVRMTAEQTKVYNELKTTMLSQYNDVELEVANKLSLLGRLQQIAGGFFPGLDTNEESVLMPFEVNPKLRSLVEDLEGFSDQSIIIVAKFTSELKALYKAIKEEYPDKVTELVFGGVVRERRTEILTRFKQGDVNFLVANAKTIGVGQNLQQSHTTLFYSNSFSYDDRIQMEDRTDRDGQTEAPLYIDYVMQSTVDMKVLDVLKEHRDLADYIRDKRLGEFV